MTMSGTTPRPWMPASLATRAGRPRCGQIRDTQRDWLFGAGSVDVGSVALVPIGPGGSLGLLACAASDTDRFNPTMSTEFLGRIGELIAAALDPG